MHHAFLELFSPRYRRRTVFNSIYLIVSLAGLWAAAVYVPAAMTYIATRTGHSAMDAAKLASYSTALLGIATVLGALIVPLLAEWLGRRATLAIFYGIMLGSIWIGIRPCVLHGNATLSAGSCCALSCSGWAEPISPFTHSGFPNSTERNAAPVHLPLSRISDALPRQVSLFWSAPAFAIFKPWVRLSLSLLWLS